MYHFILYDLKVAAVLAVFYLCYRLLLSRDTFHRLNRIVLLATSVLSCVLPLCVITLHRTEFIDAPLQGGGVPVNMPVAAEFVPAWQTTVVTLFLLGGAVVLVRLVVSIFTIRQIIRNGMRIPDGLGNTIIVTDKPVAPFSWLRYIVLSRTDWDCEREKRSSEILLHEQAHIRYRHSLDVLAADCLSALQWFNPVIWLIKSDLRAIHEYEADAAVLSQGIDARQYQCLLIRKAMASAGYSVANSFNHSTLKNRISMMLKQKSPFAASLKLLYILPLVGVSLAATARTVTDYEVRGTATESLSVCAAAFRQDSTAQDSVKQKKEPVPYMLVEVKPRFNGGDASAFAGWVNVNLKYPEAAVKNGIQGKVIVQFTVTKDGSVDQVKILHGIDPALDKEAMRVVSSSPKWTQGEMDGKPVCVTYTLPIIFKSKGEAPKKE